jgi:hypothetical protein
LSKEFSRLIEQRGLPALITLFEDVKFRGKGHEVKLFAVLNTFNVLNFSWKI